MTGKQLTFVIFVMALFWCLVMMHAAFLWPVVAIDSVLAYAANERAFR